MNYPEINFKTLYPVLVFMLEAKKDPKVLDSSPYDDSLKNAIKELIYTDVSSLNSRKSLEDVDIEDETIRLYDSMKNIEVYAEDPKEKIALLKLQSSSLKDLLDMLKESKRIKNIKLFEDTIFSILTEEQKEKVLTLI